MIRLTIDSPNTTKKSGIAKQSGKPYEMLTQDAWLHTGDKYPVKCVLTLPKGQTAGYPVGEYTVENALVPDRYGALIANRDMRIVPAQRKAAA